MRKLYLDILRIMACFMVIGNHVCSVLNEYQTVADFNWFAGALYLAFCKPAVTIFLMISGTLLLSREESYRKVFMRIVKIVAVIFLFSLLYYTPQGVADYVKSVTSHNLTKSYWYLYMYAGVLVMLPILRKMVKNMENKDYIYFFVIAFFFSSFDFLTGYNEYFVIPLFATLTGIVLLGYYIDNVLPAKYVNKVTAGLSLAGMCGTYIFVTGLSYIMFRRNPAEAYRFMVYDNIFFIFASICLYLFIKYVTIKLDKCISDGARKVIGIISSCTFGIFLLADFITDRLAPVYYSVGIISVLPLLVQVILFNVVVFVTGLAITALLKHIPLIRKLL